MGEGIDTINDGMRSAETAYQTKGKMKEKRREAGIKREGQESARKEP